MTQQSQQPAEKNAILTDQTLEVMHNITSYQDVQSLLDSLDEANASLVFDILMSTVIVFEASDIHIDTTEQGARIRIRIDSILYDVATINSHLYKLFAYRIKLMSGLKLNIKDAQDGRFSLKQTDRDLEMRVSTLPAEYGEDIAIRVLDPKKLISLTDLGMREDLFTIFQEQIKKPNGLFIVTGPTGAGKSTTLYAIIRFLQSPSVKIITIEDPIEYHLPGISQSQISERDNYTFEAGLRAILRQDPDIIMMGELRNKDSAYPALQASLAGRRVFSTLHTNDSVGSVPRLEDMGIERDTIASGLTMVIAQRLVRRLCGSCKVERATTEAEKRVLEALLQEVPDAIKQGLALDVVYDNSDNKQCSKCKGYGFKGMLGIFEVFINTKELSNIINQDTSEKRIREHLVQNNITNMNQDAAIRVLQGITSMREVERVLGVLTPTQQ